MGTDRKQALAHWQRIEGLVQEWLRERQQLLSLLCNIRGLRGIGSRPMPVEARIQRFCETLMDYISAGYFEVYRELTREARYLTGDHAELAMSIIRRLEESTDEALAFNEDFDSPEHIQAQSDVLPQRLSRLLEKLEERFALEDQLIVSIHQSNAPPRQLVH